MSILNFQFLRIFQKYSFYSLCFFLDNYTDYAIIIKTVSFETFGGDCLIYENLFLLDGLNPSEKQKIISCLPKPVLFSKKEIIYSADKFRRSLGLIVSGKATAAADNQSCVPIKNFSAGMCFGAAALFGNGDKYVSTVTAASDCEILFLSEEYLTDLFTEYPRTAVNYITFLSDRIRFLNSKLSVFSCHGAESTVLKYLSAAADSDGFADIPQNMTLLSKMLGLGRATLYRSLDSLESRGFIKRENYKIKVINNEKNY